ncbi:uncharacterized protein LOC107364730 [Tetranychus urticae]|uniref:Uncharacterized protein n=1 Tax=Tetranychus urticae TaxID=32264 RepID=T1KK00_TETUR|nr:uncharacterized protein LOC107364730 [Tetranychus urticae]
MTPLKCFHLNSVTRFILITILVSIFSQSFDCKPTNAVTIGTSEQGNISQPIDNGSRPEINLNNTLECTSGTCIYMAPPMIHDRPSIDRKRLVLDPPTNDNIGNNTNNDKSYEKDGPDSPENSLLTLEDFKIVMEPSVEKVNALDHKVTLNVNVRRKSDDRKVLELPSMEIYPNNENALVPNSSIVESLKKDLNDSISLSKLNNSLENNNRATSGNLGVNLEEDTSNYPNPDLKKNETTNAVSSPSSSTSESEIYIENNTLVVTSSTTMEPLITSERSLTPLPPNELEYRQAKPDDQPEITTTSKLMITTSNPIDEISASTLSNQVTAK